MHNYVLKLFDALRELWRFLKIVCVFCILMLLLFWIQNLTSAHWDWMGFIAPFLNGLLEIANNICGIKWNFFGNEIELKYVSALLILFGAFWFMNLLIVFTTFVEGLYRSAHFVCKKAEEMAFNKKLQNDIKLEEKKINKYSVLIYTKKKKISSYATENINLEEQNKLMNDFIRKYLNVSPMTFNGGYLYSFNNFERIDSVLDVLLKVLKSSAPIDYAICVQAGDNLEQLKRLSKLENYGKITMAADTKYRYEFNESRKYIISQLGQFICENTTLEVYEFRED